MAVSIVKVPSTASGDFDFLGFSFAGKHSWDDFGIYRTSDGDRYNDELAPPMQDLTADVPGGDGQYYFGTFHKPKVFNVNFAFDNMSEVTYREMKKWLNGKEMGDLWFEEAPYKVYTAKVTGTPQMKSLCFEINGQRVYRGDGTIQFTAYWPYAHTPDFVLSNNSSRLFEGTYTAFAEEVTTQYLYIENPKSRDVALDFYVKNGGTITRSTSDLNNPASKVIDIGSSVTLIGVVTNADCELKLWSTSKNNLVEAKADPDKKRIYYQIDGKNLLAYIEFANMFEWAAASGLSDNTGKCTGENPGQLPAPFIFKAKYPELQGQKKAFGIQVGECQIEMDEDNNPIPMLWDSKTGLVCKVDENEKKTPVLYTGKGYGSIPVGGTEDLIVKARVDSEWVNLIWVENGDWYDNYGKIEMMDYAYAKLTYHYWYY